MGRMTWRHIEGKWVISDDKKNVCSFQIEKGPDMNSAWDVYTTTDGPGRAIKEIEVEIYKFPHGTLNSVKKRFVDAVHKRMKKENWRESIQKWNVQSEASQNLIEQWNKTQKPGRAAQRVLDKFNKGLEIQIKGLKTPSYRDRLRNCRKEILSANARLPRPRRRIEIRQIHKLARPIFIKHRKRLAEYGKTANAVANAFTEFKRKCPNFEISQEQFEKLVKRRVVR